MIDPKKFSRYVDPLTRFKRRVEPDPKTGCWLWIGPLRSHRYAAFMVDGKNVAAHRWAYEHWVGPIPEGYQVDHICAVTRCVNPAHLRPLLPYDNVRAYWREQRGQCRNGHAMTPENTAWRLKGTIRQCRICERARQTRYNDKFR